eukprot:1194920-Prorocentrum_minimum.AAC.3
MSTGRAIRNSYSLLLTAKQSATAFNNTPSLTLWYVRDLFKYHPCDIYLPRMSATNLADACMASVA